MSLSESSVSYEYNLAQRFFLCCAWLDGLLELDADGKIITEDNTVRIADITWLKNNSPTFFEYWEKTGKVKYKTPSQALESVWKEVGLL